MADESNDRRERVEKRGEKLLTDEDKLRAFLEKRRDGSFPNTEEMRRRVTKLFARRGIIHNPPKAGEEPGGLH